jgi:hypothetical protein
MVQKVENLETWLDQQPDEHFPSYHKENDTSYPKRYFQLKTKLGEIHDRVELGAALNAEGDRPWLTWHGKEHVSKVIERATELTDIFIHESQKLTSFEVFVLLCAIQIHDVGNILGRKDHEKSFEQEFYEIANESNIREAATKRMIFNIAKVHSGEINGSKDTIHGSNLPETRYILNEAIRPRLLAAILRFADELADDLTRTFKQDIVKLPDNSKRHHAYSKTLHTVKFIKSDNSHVYSLRLVYELTTCEALAEYKIGNEGESKTVSLIDEIFSRTKKMERERRYCFRHIFQYVPLNEIKVEINICGRADISKELPITYTLKEEGYPEDEIEIKNAPCTVADVKIQLEMKGML